MKVARLLMMAALATTTLGCARKVVLDPVLVPGRNDPAWNIQQPPRTARPPRAWTPPGPAPARDPGPARG